MENKAKPVLIAIIVVHQIRRILLKPEIVQHLVEMEVAMGVALA
jgi:hypothetical protein